MIRKILSTVMVLCVITAMVLGIGCAAVSEYVTPASIDQRAVDCVVKAGLADPNDFTGYANLYKARLLKLLVRAAHEINMLAIEQMREKEQLDSNILQGVVERSVSEATALEEAIFDPATGLLAAGLGIFGLAGGGIIGLLRKRPGDWTQDDVDGAFVDFNIDLHEKDQQLADVVRCVQQFKDACKESGEPGKLEAVEFLKSFLQSQSKSTEAAVTAAKNM